MSSTETEHLNEKYLHVKERAVERARRLGETGTHAPAPHSDRLPPGQTLTQKFPVLDLGIQPPFDPKTWRLTVEGLVSHPVTLGWDEFRQLPVKEQTSDFHCVTTWSRYDTHWSGIPFESLCDLVEPLPEARFVLQYSMDGYMTNTSLAEMLEGDCVLAYQLDGKDIPREHGAPVRVILPRLYAWKGAKFLNRLVFSEKDKPGFWEVRGYHNHGDPWTEERFA